jgi:heme exporter protein A
MRLRNSPSGAAFFVRPIVVTAMAAAADLVAEDLSCRRGERLIFAGLSLAVPAGGAVALTGANGSGKSSLLRLLATLLTPATGRVLWGGAPVTEDIAAYRARLHYVGHLDAIKPALGVRETLGFWAAARGAEVTALDLALAKFGLDRVADWPCRWLSAGQRRRLALTRLIAIPAPLWLLDEPGAALDADGETRLDEAIATHRQVGGQVVIATHQPIALPGASELRLGEFAAPDPLAEF